jgi:hypothetical protein
MYAMSIKKIIPRKDHEVYFIPMPKEFKSYTAQQFVFDALSELHPVFSATTRVDIQTLIFNESRWFMVTVMESETLAEYQIMWQGAVFYTNTSILVHTKDFIHNAPRIIDDELIGFDTEKNKPVSVPLDAVGTTAVQSLLEDIKYISSRHGVFVKRMPKWFITTILVVVVLFTSIPLVNYFYNRKAIQPKNTVAQTDEQVTEIIYIPSAITMLAKVSEYFTQANGEIQQWQYNENIDPYIVLQCKGISVLTAHAIFNQLEYTDLQDIQDVRYIDEIPYLTVALNIKRNVYSLPVSTQFLIQNIASISAELTEALHNQNIIIVSETLPATSNNYSLYTMTYTAGGWNLVNSMETIVQLCKNYTLRVKSLNIAISSDKNIFTVTCGLSSNEKQDVFVPMLVVEKDKIPIAFGYKPNRQSTITVQTQQKPRESSVIGTIKDLNGETIYFYNPEGKIQIRSGR